MENLNARIKRLRKERGLTQEQLARLSGLSQTSISDLERGRNDGSEYLVEIAKALGVTAEFLKFRAGSKSEPSDEYLMSLKDAYTVKAIPVVTWEVVSKMDIDTYNSVSYESIDNVYLADHNETRKLLALVVHGDSMTGPNNRGFNEGDTIIFELTDVFKSGDYVIAVEKSSDSATLKKIVNDAGRWFLTPLNPAYQAREVNLNDIRIIGRVIRRVVFEDF